MLGTQSSSRDRSRRPSRRARRRTGGDRSRHRRAVRGHGRLRSSIEGEPGIGKTRLLAELAQRADARGCIVLGGSASELERDLPFWVFVDALDEYVAGLDPQVVGIAPRGGAQRARARDAVPVGVRFRRRSDRAGRAVSRPPRGARAARAAGGGQAARADARRRPLGGRRLGGAAGRAPAQPARRRRPGRDRQPPATAARAPRDGARAGRSPRWAHPAPAGRPRLATRRAPSSATTSGRERADVLYEEAGGNPFYLQQLARSQGAPARPAPGQGDLEAIGVPGAVIASITEELGFLLRRHPPGAARRGRRRRPVRVRPRRRRGRRGRRHGHGGARRAARARPRARDRRPAALPLPPSARAPGGVRERARRLAAGRSRTVRAGPRRARRDGVGAGASRRVRGAARRPGGGGRAHRGRDGGNPPRARQRRPLVQRRAATSCPATRAAGSGSSSCWRGHARWPPRAASPRATPTCSRASGSPRPTRSASACSWPTTCAGVERLLGRHEEAHGRLVAGLDQLPDRAAPDAVSLMIELAIDGLFRADPESVCDWGTRSLRGGSRAGRAPARSPRPPPILALGHAVAGSIAEAQPAYAEASALRRRDVRRGARRPRRRGRLPHVGGHLPGPLRRSGRARRTGAPARPRRRPPAPDAAPRAGSGALHARPARRGGQGARRRRRGRPAERDHPEHGVDAAQPRTAVGRGRRPRRRPRHGGGGASS